MNYWAEILLFNFIGVATVLNAVFYQSWLTFSTQVLTFLLFLLPGRDVVILSGWLLWLTMPLVDQFSIYGLFDEDLVLVAIILRDGILIAVATFVLLFELHSRLVRFSCYGIVFLCLLLYRNLIAEYVFLEILRILVYCFSFKAMHSFAVWYHVIYPLDIVWLSIGWLLFCHYWTMLYLLVIFGIAAVKYRRRKRQTESTTATKEVNDMERGNVRSRPTQARFSIDPVPLPTFNVTFSPQMKSDELVISPSASSSPPLPRVNDNPNDLYGSSSSSSSSGSPSITMRFENSVIYADNGIGRAISSKEVQNLVQQHIASQRANFLPVNPSLYQQQPG